MRRRILVVDDEPEMREALKHMLRADYDVITCGNRMEALNSLREANEPIDLVITDLKMQGGDGYELLVEIKEKRPCPRVIVMSVYFDEYPEVTAKIREQADRLVRKPLDLTEMKQVVDKLFQATESENRNSKNANVAS